ncbi:PAS domain S-box protein [Candidatus Halobeggiatoa sp. HSG11]|nr:PAS domain S-box protein [Candidatus Halobeggiatoa sp. HSG11]
MNEKIRFIALTLIMTSVALIIGSVAIGILYNTAFEQKRADLVETARSQARLIEAVARFDTEHVRQMHEYELSSDLTGYESGSAAATLSQIIDAHKNYNGWGKTGEFTLARREGDKIIFLLRHRQYETDKPAAIPFHSSLAEPMQLALTGQSGIIIGLDYQGTKVLAAHEPVAILNLGIVAKTSLAEIRAPFIRAFWIVSFIASITIAAGTLLFFAISNPIIKGIEANEKRFRSITQLANDAIIATDENGMINFWNNGAEKNFGYNTKEILGKHISILMPDKYKATHKKYFSQVQITGETHLKGKTIEVSGLRKSGKEFPLDISVTTWVNKGKRAFSAVIRDMTKRKRTEQELKKHRNNLEELVKERTVKLNQTNKQLQAEITERKQAEKNIKQQEKFLRNLVNTVPSLIFVKNWEGKFILVNQATADIYGSTIKNLEGKTDADFNSNSKEVEQFLAADRKVLTTGQSLFIPEETVTGVNNQPRFFQTIKTLLPSDDDKNKLLLGVATDITKRRQAEQALKESEKILKESQKIAHLGQWTLDLISNKLHWSDEIYRIFNVEPDQFEPTYEIFVKLIHPDDREMVNQAYLNSLKNKTNYNIVHRLLLKDGKVKFVNEICHTEYDKTGKPLCSMGTVQDITEYKQVEESLRRFRVALDNAADAIFIIDRQAMQFVDMNKMASDSTGYLREELLTMGPQDIKPYCTKFQLAARFDEVIHSNQQGIIKTIHHRKDGSEFPVEILMQSLKLDTGCLIVASVRNITERQQAEDALRQAKEKADAANHAKSEFLANMSHEIRTPMNAILGFTEILFSKVQEPQYQEYLAAINSSGKTLLSLLNDILDLAKVEAGKLELEYTAVEPAKVFHDIGQLFISKISEKQLEFKIHIAPNMPSALYLDETRLRQILLNLLSNAVKFTDSGFIKLTSSWIKTTTEQGEFIFTVEDSGKGINIKHQETVFTAFTQQNGQEHARYGGTGLGLTITRRLVEMMNGTISINSTLKKGSIFNVRFPQVEVATSIANESATNYCNLEKFQFKSAKILIVEDIKLNRDLITAYLAPYKTLELLETDNGKDAIILAEQHHPNLILMDKKMPIMNGYEAAKQIKSHPNLKHIPIVFITASLMKTEKEKLKKLCDGLLGKPINRHDLIIEISNFLAHSKEGCDKIINQTKNEVIPLTSEMLTKLFELLDILHNEIDTQWQNISQTSSLGINALITFGERVQTLGNEHGYPPLQDWGDMLQNQAKLFDMNTLPITLQKYPDLVNDLTELVNHEK